jgi:cytidine deaminase
MTPSVPRSRALEEAARRAADASYAPYSRFPVGAAVLAGDGRIYRGGNIENASFGLSCCAERVAIFAAVAAGNRSIAALAIYTPTSEATPPCGACRQVLFEFGPEAGVVCLCDGERRIETTAAKLLPRAFGPRDLRREGNDEETGDE